MEPPSNPTVRSSAIPRLSRLPLPRAPEKLEEKGEPVRYTLKSRVAPRAALRDPINPIGSARREAKPATESEHHVLKKFSNDSDQQLDDEAVVPSNSEARTLPRRPRPSLSDRTIETLAQIPPSPSPRKRRSSFFPSESPSQSHSRPGSSLSRSRPSTSHGQQPPLPSGFPASRPASPNKRQPALEPGGSIAKPTPSRRSFSSYVPKSLPQSTANSYAAMDSTPSKLKPPVPSPANWAQNQGLTKETRNPMRGSKTLAARTPRQRPSVQDAFTKPLSKATGLATKKVAPCSGSPTFSIPMFSPPSNKSSRTSSGSGEPLSTKSYLPSSPKVPSSSLILRETIAKAKAARQKVSKQQDKTASTLRGALDAFPNIEIGGDHGHLLRKRVATARTDGRLTIAALGLKEMPIEVMNMYNANLGDGAWYESVDLLRLIAADNEFEHLGDTCFPDEPVRMDENHDEHQGNLFAGLETLDLHGNNLKTVPVGLRRLEHLTTLNVSKNALRGDSLSIIGQIKSLRELRLAGNNLDVISDIFELHSLEVLDLHSNAIGALPSDIRHLPNLHVLNVSGNKLGSLPFEYLGSLVELNAAQNRLSGALIQTAMDLPNLKSLDVASNALTSVTVHATVHFPSLRALNITENSFQDLPDISGWTELITLTAEGNKLTALPEGFVSLPRLKTVDFSRNDIRKLDERIGSMDSLTVLRVANNPLRERRYLTMETEELKRDLTERNLSEKSGDHAGGEYLGSETTGLLPDQSKPDVRIWPVKPGGILDRSSTKMENLEYLDLEPLVAFSDIKSVILHHNLLSCIPPAITVMEHSLTNLDVSNNKLASSAYFGGEMSLPNLRSLDISYNAINSLLPLLNYLSAPKLAELNVSRNRLASLLPLRDAFPSLVSLIAADNSVCILEVEVVRGLQVLDVSGNEVNHLEPRLGLLGAEGLRTLVVGGNRFRVPRRDVLDKGTDAVLTWLRGRIPEGKQ